MAINDEKTVNGTENEEASSTKEGKSSAFWQKASEIGKKAADGIQKGAKVVADKTKEELHAQKLRKYNPLFAKEYKSKGFDIADVIIIEDDKVIQNIDVCEGAIGWREMAEGVEILHLSDEWVKNSGLEFIPSAICNDVYCVDVFDRQRYIKADLIFKKAHEERLAELKRIAYTLGAKNCSIEIEEIDGVSKSRNMSANIKLDGSKADAGFSASVKNGVKQSGKIVATFNGSDEPQKPDLKWFIHDDNINNLINMRCANKNSIKYEVLQLNGSSSATMSKKTAAAIDGIMKMKGSLSMESQSVKEHSSKLIFEVEF